MYKRSKQLGAGLLAFLLALLLVSPSLLTQVSAESEIVSAKHFNVMLVTDGSGSLITTKGDATDPNGLRYDAVDLFLGLLTNSGNYVGAIVFDNSDPMPLETAPTAISGTVAKQNLSEQVRSAPVGGDTDIGSALLRSVEMLEDVQAENGLPSVVVILTDGITDLDNNPSVESAAETASLSKESQAIGEAAENQIQIFSVMLNDGGTLDTTEAQSLATDGDHFAEVTSAEDLDQIFAKFYAMIYTTELGTSEEVIDASGKAHKEIPVPPFGVEELNIVIKANSPLESVTITQPDGTALTGEELEDYAMTTDSFQLIKLTDPVGGTWTVDVTGTPNEKVTFNTVYNADMTVDTFVEGDADSFTSGEEITISSQLYENRSLITAAEAYQADCAVLTLTNTQDPTDTYTYPMSAAGDRYTATFTLPDVGENPAAYNVQVDVNVASIMGSSTGLELDVNPDYVGLDTAPNTVQNPVTLDVKEQDTLEVSLSDWFQDADGDELTYAVAASDYDSGLISISGTTMTIQCAGMVDGTVKIRATDPLGLSCTLTVNIDGNNPPVASQTDVEHRVTVNMFFNTTDSLDLTQWISDEEDSTLTYEIVDVQSKGDVADQLSIDQSAQTLNIATKGFQRSDVTLRATDSDGASCLIYFHFTILNLGLIASLGAATIVLIVVAILIILAIVASHRRFGGQIVVEPIAKAAASSSASFGGGNSGFGSGFGGENSFGGFDTSGSAGFDGFGGGDTMAGNTGFDNGGAGSKQTIPAFRGKKSFSGLMVPRGNLSGKAAFVALTKNKLRIKSPTAFYTQGGAKKAMDLTIGARVEIFDSQDCTTGLRITLEQAPYSGGFGGGSAAPKSRKKSGKKRTTTTTTSAMGGSVGGNGFGGNGFG
jgi:hypothetical protein